jgi:hypothetical protein
MPSVVVEGQFCHPFLRPRQTFEGLEHNGMKYVLVEIVNTYFPSGENAVRAWHCAGAGEPVGFS